MKEIFYIVSVILLVVSCNDSDAPDCLKKRGETTEVRLEVDDFTGIHINEEFTVLLEQANEPEVILTTGSNLIDKIRYQVINGVLTFSDENTCNWVRDYNFPVIHIRHPNLTEIRQNGGGVIRSINILTYPDLTLISEKSTGNFELTVAGGQLVIISNELSNYYLSGTVDKLIAGFFAGDGRLEAPNLLATDVNVYHAGTNDMIVNATHSLTGRILSSGDVIYVGTTPSLIDVSLENKGGLIDRTNE